MLVGVMLARFFGVMLGVDMVTLCDVRVMPGFLMVPGAVMLGGCAMVFRGVLVMLGSFQMMLGGVL